jgi:hypothetical protein
MENTGSSCNPRKLRSSSASIPIKEWDLIINENIFYKLEINFLFV